MAEYEMVTSNYTIDCTNLLGKWEQQNVSSTMSGQHWDGSSKSTYFEQLNGWTGYDWQMSMRQQATLPPGQYVLKVACRSASDNVDAQRATLGEVYLPTVRPASTLQPNTPITITDAVGNGATFLLQSQTLLLSRLVLLAALRIV